MAKRNEEFVTHIASRSDDFPQWYTDVILKTDMVDYSIVKGCMVIKPYGYGVWELIQNEMDRRFKETGHVNAYFPLLIPESLLKKEAEHVEGFAPEVAWVTHGGDEELTERLCIRPTSETIICSMYSKWIQSYRDLPLLINQWANVVRWEKNTRPFLRTSEFLWQEGHTAHATFEEAEAETQRMLEVYREFAQNVLAIPVICGRKSEKEKFAGAQATYTIEAMMQDGKALQMGTSHNLSDHFAKAYDIKYLSKDGKLEHCFTTSWGTSTRMIGGLIMVHGDDRGLVLPPRVAPIQLVILPIAMHKAGVIEKADEIYAQLKSAGIRVKVDDSDQTAGWKFNQWEMKGVPVRLEVGPKDIENKQVVLVRRDTHEKYIVPMETLTDTVKKLLDDIHESLYNRALAFREAKTVDATTFEELKNGVNGGFVRAMWCGDRECEDAIKEKTGATTRCMPFEQKHLSDVCVHCGKPAKAMTYFAKSY
ncbi:MAG: proline--tRNA ligase [Christensenellales bacterium]|nr:proline--tRNA ligase [Clostridiales bacterium]MDY5732661.1 proline--tRNA ligase [Eubacteriales bacterium]